MEIFPFPFYERACAGASNGGCLHNAARLHTLDLRAISLSDLPQAQLEVNKKRKICLITTKLFQISDLKGPYCSEFTVAMFSNRDVCLSPVNELLRNKKSPSFLFYLFYFSDSVLKHSSDSDVMTNDVTKSTDT